MGHLGQSFTHLETRAESISIAQTLQAETQARLHDQMEVAMQVAQGYLSEISSTALQLQTIISETASKIQSMTTFACMFGVLLDWVLTVCFGLFAFSALAALVTVWRYSHKAAMNIILAISKFSPLSLVRANNGHYSRQSRCYLLGSLHLSRSRLCDNLQRNSAHTRRSVPSRQYRLWDLLVHRYYLLCGEDAKTVSQALPCLNHQQE